MSTLGELDLFLFNEGTHSRLYEKLGAHVTSEGGLAGTRFSVWAPNAEEISVFGDWNGWQKRKHLLAPVASSGIWSVFVPGVGKGAHYKYHVRSRHLGYAVDKADPFATYAEVPPATASVVWPLGHVFADQSWMETRASRQRLSSPISIYELHLGSFRRVPEEQNRPLTYRELAPLVADHVAKLGFTHVELLPITEHPFYASWGYQATGYFAPTSRFGTPDDFAYFVDHLHQRGIGVILDWVPSHFPTDAHGLHYFDGTHLYEHADPRQGHHPDWKSAIFNYGRNEVRAFLYSSACYWLDRFHLDGIRVDAVASMLYLDYSRKEGEWIPNSYGGRENLEAIGFLRQLNKIIYERFPGVQTIAEESTAWPMVSRPTEVGGLGFGLKWDMGWMHDTLDYFQHDPVHRRYHHDRLTFRGLYANHENFVLPLSHDEVVHGKGPLFDKMAGDEWQRYANLRLLYAYMYGLAGKKLLFMGDELAQRREWHHDRSLDWHLLEHAPHRGVLACVAALNRLYRDTPALHEKDCEPSGFQWIDCNDVEQSVVSFLRRGKDERTMIVVCNFTPVVRHGYRVGVPRPGRYVERLNTDAVHFGGSGVGSEVGEAEPTPTHGQPYGLRVTLPPLAAVFLSL